MNSKETTEKIIELMRHRHKIIKDEFPKGSIVKIPRDASIINDCTCMVVHISENLWNVNRIEALVKDKAGREFPANALFFEKVEELEGYNSKQDDLYCHRG